MAIKFFNRVKVIIGSTGTGAVTPGAAYSGFRSLTDAGVVEGDEFRYVLEQSVNWEIGVGTYTSGLILRAVTESSNGNEPLNLSEAPAVLYITATAAEFASVTALGDIEAALAAILGEG